MDTAPPSRAERAALRRADQDRNLFSRVPAAAIASRLQAQRLLKTAGDLSVTEWRILWDLSEAGPLTITDMASIQRTDHSLISRAIPGMRGKGYITAVTDDGDRRQSLVALTAEGERAFHAAAGVMRGRRDGLADAFSDADLEAFLGYLDRYEAFLTEATETPEGTKSTE